VAKVAATAIATHDLGGKRWCVQHRNQRPAVDRSPPQFSAIIVFPV